MFELFSISRVGFDSDYDMATSLLTFFAYFYHENHVLRTTFMYRLYGLHFLVIFYFCDFCPVTVFCDFFFL